MLWLRRRSILGFWICLMVPSLSDCLLGEILGLGGGFLSLTLLFLHILDPDGDLARAHAISAKGMATGITVGSSEASVVSAGISQISGGKKTFSDNLKAESAGIPVALRA